MEKIGGWGETFLKVSSLPSAHIPHHPCPLDRYTELRYMFPIS